MLSPEEVHEGEHQAKEAHEEVHSHELSPTPPIEESTGSTEKTPEEEILENRTRYSPEQLAVVDSAVAAFRSTRQTNRIADSVILQEFEWWANHEIPKVVAGLRIYVEKGYAAEGKDENYARGIIRNCNEAEGARSLPPKKTEFPKLDAGKAKYLAARRSQSQELVQ